eukprot:2913430-Pleurochrysis_carterae.AAC.1
MSGGWVGGGQIGINSASTPPSKRAGVQAVKRQRGWREPAPAETRDRSTQCGPVVSDQPEL